MIRRILALIFIYSCTCVAWVILGGVTYNRTYNQDTKLRGEVGQLWGTVQAQQAPDIYYLTRSERKVENFQGSTTKLLTEEVVENHPLNLDGTDARVWLGLEYRKKGLLWYSTYTVKFDASYKISNSTAQARLITFDYAFPTSSGIYDNFLFNVNGSAEKNLRPSAGRIVKDFFLNPGEGKTIEISYESRGLDQWWYRFGSDVSQISDFSLVLKTNFTDYDFPENCISPTAKELNQGGANLTWKYKNLISGIQIGVQLPQKMNPGPFASRISFFAPVSLFFFFFLMFVITTLKRINLHPMNYFFLSAAFFSFHLLMSYLVDHLEIGPAFTVCSLVSIFLVVSYMRLVAGNRFAFLEAGMSQFVYLVLFSSAFFFEGYTGLMITVCSIITLFVIMQITGRVDWEKQLSMYDKR
ncbi:MAG: inner membrane CreD family protein [Candidatus Wallbacteria bacterium]|nr:inner membrane CreD family protein [Candidatus Wallbacteria bacterium]